MLIHELSAEECAECLVRTSVGRLACALFHQPYIVPIHFSFDAKRSCLYAFSMVGQKVEWMRKNPRVCVEVEEITNKHDWTTVVVFGRYHEISRSDEDAAERESVEQLFRARPEWWLPGAGKVLSREHHDMVIYRIEIDRLTGRRVASPAE